MSDVLLSGAQFLINFFCVFSFCFGAIVLVWVLIPRRAARNERGS